MLLAFLRYYVLSQKPLPPSLLPRHLLLLGPDHVFLLLFHTFSTVVVLLSTKRPLSGCFQSCFEQLQHFPCITSEYECLSFMMHLQQMVKLPFSYCGFTSPLFSLHVLSFTSMCIEEGEVSEGGWLSDHSCGGPGFCTIQSWLQRQVESKGTVHWFFPSICSILM